MQPAVRVDDRSAFIILNLGQTSDRSDQLVEFEETSRIVTKPSHEETEDNITGRFG